MKSTIPLLLFLLIAATATAQHPGVECDGFRRKVSILIDPDTMFLDTAGYDMETGLRTLTQLPAFTPTDTTPRQEVERRVQYFDGLRHQIDIIAFRQEHNGDIYLVLRDPFSDSTMLAAIPNPDCPDVSATSRAPLYRQCRDRVIAEYGVPDTALTYVQLGHPVMIMGIPFYNQPREEKEQAANGIELHPVLSIQFYIGDVPSREGGAMQQSMDLSCSEQ